MEKLEKIVNYVFQDPPPPPLTVCQKIIFQLLELKFEGEKNLKNVNSDNWQPWYPEFVFIFDFR